MVHCCLLSQIDFDKWKMEDDDEIASNMADNNKDEFSEEHMATHPSFDLENLRKTYLFVYNLWQFLGFTYIFCTLVSKYSKFGSG